LYTLPTSFLVLCSYEKASDFVVPRSARLIQEDNEYALFTVVVFKRVADNFKQQIRQHGAQVRETKFLLEPAQAGGGAVTDVSEVALRERCNESRLHLEEWLRSAFSEAFQGFAHAMVVRVFVESILRYGLPPSFQAVVMKPRTSKVESKLRSILNKAFARGDASLWSSDPEDAKSGMFGMEESHPYVSYVISF